MREFRSLWAWGPTAVAVVLSMTGLAIPSIAQNGATTDPAKLLEQLKALEDIVIKARSGNNLAALNAITDAISADNKAVALWTESVHETEFRAKDKKESEFREWRDGAGRRLTEPGAAAALRLHLKYLLLTIRVADAITDDERNEILPSLLAYLDDLSRADKDTLKNRQALDTPVLSTPIAKRFKLDVTVRTSDAWSQVPGNLEAIYESSILPYLREKKDVGRLQTAWSRRLQQEAALVATQESEVLTKEFREIELPSLEWAQARDLYLAGSIPAASKMLQIIKQNQAHKNTPQWIKELRNLLTYGQETAPDELVKKPDPEAESGTLPPEVPESITPAPPSARPRGPVPTLPANRNP